MIQTLINHWPAFVLAALALAFAGAAVDLSTIHINRALDSMSTLLNNKPEQYMYGKVCARRPVDALSDNFFQYGREGGSHAPTAGQSNVRFLPSVTNPGSPAPVIDQAVTTGLYQCRRYSYRDFVTDREIMIADEPLSPLKDAGMMALLRVTNDIEGIIANIIATYGNYPAGNRAQLTTGANGTSWNAASSGGTGSHPFNDIRAARLVVAKSIQMKPNVLAISNIAKMHLNDHADLKNILQYTDEGYVEGEGIPEHLRGLRFVTGDAVWNTGADGAAYSGDFIFGDQSEATPANQPCALVCYLPEEKTIGPRGFSSFIWFDAPDEVTGARGVSMRAYRDENKRGFFVESAMTADVQPGIVDSNSKITGAYMISRAAIP
jgi:hypothetical protein